MTSSNSFEVFKGGWAQNENAVFTENAGTLDSETFSFFIKPDGLTVFALHTTVVEEHPLTVPWDVATVQPEVNMFSITGQTTTAFGLYFKDDGTKMFINGAPEEELFEYDLSTPWDITTAVFNSVSLDLSAVPVSDIIRNCVFSQDGDFAFITTGTSLFSYALDTDWDAGSNTTSPVIFTPDAPILVDSVAFKSEGQKMYIGHSIMDEVHEFDLVSPYNIAGAIDTGKVLDTSTESIKPDDIFWRSNGTELFVLGTATLDTKKFHLESQWDISTASFFNNDLLVAEQPRAIYWKPDGTKMFELDLTIDTVRAYDITVDGTPFNTNTLTELNDTFEIEDDEFPVGIFWSNDGLLLFVAGIQNDKIYRYVTTVPFSIKPGDINSVPDQQFEIIGTNAPTGLWFSPDGNILLISASDTPRHIFQYTLPNPYDISGEGAPTKTLDIPLALDINPRDLFLKPDGLQMFLPSIINDSVARYVITTPLVPKEGYDIETAVLTDEFFIPASVGDPFPSGISLNNDGTKMFISDVTERKIFTFDLSLEFNNSIITNLGEDLITNAGDRLVYA